LRSDVPVGSSLSGGLDSSTIVCLLNSFHLGPQNTFSASFPGYEKDETAYMKMVIENASVTPHFTTPTATDLAEQLDLLFYHQEEPFGSASILAQWEVMKLAKQNATIVLLDGQGADELLGGYTFYYRTFFQELYATDKQLFKKEYSAYKTWGGNHFPYDWKFKAQAQFPNLYNQYLAFRSGPVAHPDIHPDFYNQHKSTTYKAPAFKPLLNSHLHNTLCISGFENLLRYADRNSMAFSREVRLPYLDHQLVEFSYSLPSTYKIHNGWSKYLLRKSFEGIIPEKITWRKDKIGYAPPENQWMQTSAMKEILNEGISKLSREKIINSAQLDPGKMWVYLMVSKLLANG
jgi:asparagine synthase (glutamine-hydrolysing)